MTTKASYITQVFKGLYQMQDQYSATDHKDSYRRTSIPWMAILTVAAFMFGIVVSVATGWGTRSTQLDGLTLEVARLAGAVSTLTEKYTNTDKTTSTELQKVSDHFERLEEHLSHTDARIDRLEGRSR